MKKIIAASAALLAVGSLSLGVTSLSVSANGTNLEGFEIAGASIRMATPVGMRFITEVPESIKDSYTFGTLIIPKADLGEATLDVNTAKALNIETSKWQDKKENEPYMYASVLGGVENGGSITNFPKSQYNAPIVARSYAKDGEGNVVDYTETVERSLAGVASMALADTTDDGKITDDTQRTFLKGICDYVLGTDGFAMQNASIAGTGAKDLSILFDETNSNEGLTAIWSVVNGEAIELQYNQHGIATTMTVVGEGSVTLEATIGTFTETVTVTVAEPTALAQTKYYDMSASTDLTLDLTTLGITGNVTKMTVAGTVVTPVVEENTLTVANVETVLDITDIYNDTGAKEVVISTADAEYALNTVFVTKIIRQSDLTNNTAADFQAILYNDEAKYSVGSFTHFGGYYVLGEDLTFEGTVDTPVAIPSTYGYKTRFAGTLDGLGYSLSNVVVNTGKNLLGNLGHTGVVRNLKITGAQFQTTSATATNILFFGIYSYKGYQGIVENVYMEMSMNAVGSTTATTGNSPFAIYHEGLIRNCILKITNSCWTLERQAQFCNIIRNTGAIENSYAIVDWTYSEGTETSKVKLAMAVKTTAGDISTAKVIISSYAEQTTAPAIGKFFTDTTVNTANYSKYWNINATAQTISMNANANDIK